MARRQSSSKKRSSRRPSRAAGGRVALALGLLTLVAITFWVLRAVLAPSPPAKVPPQAPAAPSAPAPRSGPASSPPAAPTPAPSPKLPPALPYEAQTEDAEVLVHFIDDAITRAAESCGLDARNIHIASVDTHTTGLGEIQFQTIEIPAPDPARFRVALEQILARLPRAPRLFSRTPDARDLEVRIQGVTTHRIILQPEPPLLPPTTTASGQLVIIIDDLGQDLVAAQTLASLPIPVVFSILPYTPKAQATADIAHRAGRDVLVHLPCEPHGFPHPNSGPGTLMAGMDAARIHALVDEALLRVPHAIGANNHMGSRFTEDYAGVTAMLKALHRRGKIFVDSATTAKSAVPAVSRDANLPYLRRTTFLDNVASTPAVLAQLRKAEAIAHKKGVAIAIGHPYPQTLRALTIWAREHTGGAQVVSLSRLAPRFAQIPSP
ncbi:MAG: hypothetical protein JG774_353 [Desulfomicrobiaceae bacterium]|nr:divergent polysaccharide deacetylase family protein [Desulfomicrobiaceae bacterium]MBZ4647928.1 hypothetical protein [Desulfomicrobiaceae bacterium]MBZ4684608.1 hypothetical protein [Desulfomicrobiaceae bacterium]MDI3492767.1 uncharacterized protein [Desulfomicrobiaceae bacterium]MDK2873396.1 uncharacterized protein [Desulfomicrobiaceae bacterium]